jgi:uncharacterized protein with HEPN domain
MSKRDPRLRNRIVHEYFGLDLGIIWYIITGALPQLKQMIRNLLI